jgi:hypothetical protein
MTDELKRGQPDIGHSSTTAPGGEKDLPTGDPGRTPGKAEGNEEDVEGSHGTNEGRGEKAK